MPIVFAQPEPFAPSINSEYGKALQFSQDAPQIAGLAEHAAAASMQREGMQQQAELARSALAADTANRQADRYFASDVAQANREQSGQELAAQLDNRSDLGLLAANTQLAQQQQAAQLTDWVNQQDMTRKDQARLQQLQAGVSDVMQNPSFGPPGVMTPERADLVTQMKTGIDVGAQKMRAAQMKNMQSMDQLHQAQTQQQLQKTKMQQDYANASFDQLVRSAPDPDALAEFGLEAAQQGLQGQAAMAYVNKRAAETGRMSNWILKPDQGGNFSWEQVKKDKSSSQSDHVEFDEAKALKRAEAEAELAVPRNTVVDGKIVDTAEEVAERNKYKTKVFERLRDSHGKQPAAGGQPQAGPPPTGDVKQDVGTAFNQKLQSIQSNPAIPAPIRQETVSSLAMAQMYLGRVNGNVNKLTEDEKAVVKRALLLEQQANQFQPTPVAPQQGQVPDDVRRMIEATQRQSQGILR